MHLFPAIICVIAFLVNMGVVLVVVVRVVLLLYCVSLVALVVVAHCCCCVPVVNVESCLAVDVLRGVLCCFSRVSCYSAMLLLRFLLLTWSVVLVVDVLRCVVSL